MKVKELQEELENTEIEAVAADGGVTVTISGAQVARLSPAAVSPARLAPLPASCLAPLRRPSGVLRPRPRGACVAHSLRRSGARKRRCERRNGREGRQSRL